MQRTPAERARRVHCPAQRDTLAVAALFEEFPGAARKNTLQPAGSSSAVAAIAGGAILGSRANAAEDADRAVEALDDSLTDVQRKAMCFEWDKKGDSGGLRGECPERFPLRLICPAERGTRRDDSATCTACSGCDT